MSTSIHQICTSLTSLSMCLFFFRGDSTSVQAGNLVTTLWLDNCVVRVMSMNSQPKDSSQVLRQQHNGSRVSVQCPTAVAQYNKFMGGVDRNDQLQQYYNVGRKGRKYYRYIFWFLFEVSISNSFIMYSKYGHFTRQNPAPKSFLDYRVQLYHQLVGDYNSRKRPGHGQTARSSLAIRHFPIKERSGRRSGMSRCWFCAHSRQPPRRKETVWYCGDCRLHLCHTGETDGSDCFLLYHQHMYT